MGSTYQKLFEFITAAETSRKYPPATATSYRSALRLIEAELNEEEKESIETFKTNLDQIFQTYYSKHPARMSAESFEEYKRRIRRLLRDYDSYGVDASKMASWNREIIIRKSNKEKGKEKIILAQDNSEVDLRPAEQGSIAVTRFELPIRPDAKVIILTPMNMTKDEIKKVKNYINYLEMNAENESEAVG